MWERFFVHRFDKAHIKMRLNNMLDADKAAMEKWYWTSWLTNWDMDTSDEALTSLAASTRSLSNVLVDVFAPQVGYKSR